MAAILAIVPGAALDIGFVLGGRGFLLITFWASTEVSKGILCVSLVINLISSPVGLVILERFVVVLVSTSLGVDLSVTLYK